MRLLHGPYPYMYNYMYIQQRKIRCVRNTACTGGILFAHTLTHTHTHTHSLVASVLPSESLVLPGLLPVSTVDRQSIRMHGL